MAPAQHNEVAYLTSWGLSNPTCTWFQAHSTQRHSSAKLANKITFGKAIHIGIPVVVLINLNNLSLEVIVDWFPWVTKQLRLLSSDAITAIRAPDGSTVPYVPVFQSTVLICEV